MKKLIYSLSLAVVLMTACTSVQIKQVVSDAKTASASFLHENGISVRNDPARNIDTKPYRTNLPDKQLSVVPPVMQSRVFSSPESTLPEVVKALTAGIDDQVRIAKILHDWIALNINYDVASFCKEDIPDQSYSSVLRSRKAVCEGYANLYSQMCSLAKIKCQKISGYARGVGFNPLVPEDVTQPNHAWNAVQLNGNWYLVDTTWDAGSVNGCGTLTFTRRYSTAYFLLDPKSMIYSHFPTIPMWQLLDTPLNKKDFAMLPHLDGDFFDSIEVLDTALQSINRVEDSTSISLKLRDDRKISAMLFDADRKSIDGTVLIQKQEDRHIIRIAFPSTKQHYLILFAGDLKSSSLSSIAEIAYMPSKASSMRYPQITGSSLASNMGIASPESGILKKGVPVLFKIRIPNIKSAAVIMNRSFTEMSLSPEGYLEASFTPTAKGEIHISVPTNSMKTSFETVLIYTVID